MAPHNTFAGARLDRGGPLRRNAEWLAARAADPRSRALVVTRQGVYLTAEEDDHVPESGAGSEALYDPRAWLSAPGGALAAASLPLTDALALPGATAPVLLGLREDGAALFAVDGDATDRTALDEALAPAALAGVRDAAARLPPQDAGLVAYATAMLNWHRRHRFCANCGAPTDPREAGHLRICPACGANHHPRTDPVVIMLVKDDGRERVLLGRQPTWPAGRYSALAGFVEPGESLEEAVLREVLEESGVHVAHPRYASSQPWPFPASLMLGFTADHVSGEPVAADGELEDARWFDREEIEAAAAGHGEVHLPPPVAIARRLIEGWLAGS
jgi:NAD+ diphosphatase